MNEQEFRKQWGLDAPKAKGIVPQSAEDRKWHAGVKKTFGKAVASHPTLRTPVAVTPYQKQMQRWVSEQGKWLAVIADRFCDVEPEDMEHANMTVGETEMQALLGAGWCVECYDFTGQSHLDPESCNHGSHTKDWH